MDPRHAELRGATASQLLDEKPEEEEEEDDEEKEAEIKFPNITQTPSRAQISKAQKKAGATVTKRHRVREVDASTEFYLPVVDLSLDFFIDRGSAGGDKLDPAYGPLQGEIASRDPRNWDFSVRTGNILARALFLLFEYQLSEQTRTAIVSIVSSCAQNAKLLRQIRRNSGYQLARGPAGLSEVEVAHDGTQFGRSGEGISADNNNKNNRAKASADNINNNNPSDSDRPLVDSDIYTENTTDYTDGDTAVAPGAHFAKVSRSVLGFVAPTGNPDDDGAAISVYCFLSLYYSQAVAFRSSAPKTHLPALRLKLFFPKVRRRNSSSLNMSINRYAHKESVTIAEIRAYVWGEKIRTSKKKRQGAQPPQMRLRHEEGLAETLEDVWQALRRRGLGTASSAERLAGKRSSRVAQAAAALGTAVAATAQLHLGAGAVGTGGVAGFSAGCGGGTVSIRHFLEDLVEAAVQEREMLRRRLAYAGGDRSRVHRPGPAGTMGPAATLGATPVTGARGGTDAASLSDPGPNTRLLMEIVRTCFGHSSTFRHGGCGLRSSSEKAR